MNEKLKVKILYTYDREALYINGVRVKEQYQIRIGDLIETLVDYGVIEHSDQYIVEAFDLPDSVE